jgi:hypothetical protein
MSYIPPAILKKAKAVLMNEADPMEFAREVVGEAERPSTERERAFIEGARDLCYGQVDDDAVVSESGDNSGAYVMAWLWVPIDDAVLEPLGDGDRDEVDGE